MFGFIREMKAVNDSLCTAPGRHRSIGTAATVFAMSDDACTQDMLHRCIMDSSFILLVVDSVLMGLLDG